MNLRQRIKSLKKQGFGNTAISRQLDCHLSTVYYHTNEETRRRQIDRLTKLKKRNKERGVKLLGGKCQKCDYERCLDALTFHHRDPNIKETRLSGQPMSWSKFKAELDKCVLLCCLCHTELHAGLWNKQELRKLRLIFIPNGHNTGKLILPPSKRRRS